MTVRELIKHLKQYPQDAVVITTMCSDYEEVEPDSISLMEPKDGEGIINHHGHIMYLEKNWWPYAKGVEEVLGPAYGKPKNPKFLTCVHFRGN